MSNKDRARLCKINAVVNSINRIFNEALQRLQSETIKDLKDLRERLRAEQQALITKNG